AGRPAIDNYIFDQAEGNHIPRVAGVPHRFERVQYVLLREHQTRAADGQSASRQAPLNLKPALRSTVTWQRAGAEEAKWTFSQFLAGVMPANASSGKGA